MRSESNTLDWDGMEDEDCRISHESESSDSSFGADDAASNEFEFNGTDDNPAESSNSPQQAIGAELSLSSLVAPPLVQSTQTGRPLSEGSSVYVIIYVMKIPGFISSSLSAIITS